MDLKRLGKYEIVVKIGQGAMGEVYRAHDPVLGRDVAIKTMAPGVVADDDLRKRFRREAQSAARLNHPNIITVHDFGEEEGHVYMAMELLEGFDLKELIARQTPMVLEAKLSLMEQICDGLAFAHAHDVVHRDLKPANIHILPTGQVRIMDFGLARVSTSDMTRAGAIMGTPNYMSPEQVRGEKATARSDVFSLGAVFYELLGGRKPFDAESLPAILYQVLQLEPEPLERIRPELPPALCRVVARALAKNAADRYADGGEMREALRGLHLPVTEARRSEASGRQPRAPEPEPAGVRAHPGSRTSRPTLTRVPASPSHGDGSASREATVAAPAPEETLAVRQATLSGGPTTQVPATVLQSPPVERKTAAGRRVAAVVVATALATAVIYIAAIRRPPTEAVAPSPVPATTNPEPTHAPPSLDPARQSLQRKAFREASSQAQEVLRVEPDSIEARQVLEEAGKGLAAIESAARPVREALAAGDAEAATKALARLQALDPEGPETVALATRVGDVVKGRVQEARESMDRARRDAEERHGGATPEFASASTTARQGEAALRQGDLPLAARRFALAREGFEKAREASAASVAKTAAPAPIPPASLAPIPPTPAPPPATLAGPPTAPPAPVQTEAAAKQAIRGVLDEYRQAFENRNVDALKAVQPGVDYEAMKKTFAEVTSYGVKIQIQEVTVEGTKATATGVVTYSPVPKPAGKIQPVLTVFHLRKAADLWLIERLERK